ncbi:DUF4240 domain-containing protein [Nonomuraea sp. NN258]|uniref:DUF4240 domain-containing protein n=1 Tax=Nonomuraea antri TaxID=2730852 RepID=UPI00156A1C0B|nr:DUF4240 domain-containing protein [Nonomuraea antri]NRQ35226.1 DUF4240 domain-containing protein [Nonomuraea antri]
MELDDFWELVEGSRPVAASHGQEAQIDWLTARLAAASPERIKAFHRHWLSTMNRAYTWDLWGAAYLASGGYCSDDGFEYFRAWLILQGRRAFERAVTEPDSLADLGLPLAEAGSALELPLGIAREAFVRVMGLDDPDDADELFDVADELALDVHPRGPAWPPDLRGFRERWPRLWARTDHRGWATPPRSGNQGHPGLINLVLPHDLT